MHLLDTGSGALLHRLPVGWRGPADQLPDPEDWQGMNIVTSVQLLPGGSGLVLAGCMDGHIQLLDPRCRQPAVLQLSWSGHRQHARAQLQQRFWRAGEPSRLCAARCQEHLLVAGGDAAAVSLHDLRMVAKHSSSSGGGGCNGVSSGNGGSGAGGSSGVDSSNGAGSGSGPAGPRNGCFAELVLPAAFGQRMPSVFAMDLLYPRLAVGGDRGQVLVRPEQMHPRLLVDTNSAWLHGWLFQRGCSCWRACGLQATDALLATQQEYLFTIYSRLPSILLLFTGVGPVSAGRTSCCAATRPGSGTPTAAPPAVQPVGQQQQQRPWAAARRRTVAGCAAARRGGGSRGSCKPCRGRNGGGTSRHWPTGWLALARPCCPQPWPVPVCINSSLQPGCMQR